MGNHLKKFEKHTDYEADKSGLLLPNVSACVQENEVHFNSTSPTPPTPSHPYVEIGGRKWATMNVGATAVTDYGLYFQWGDTQGYTADQVGSGSGKKYFGWNDYKYGQKPFSKYDRDGKTVLESSDDAVTAAWGGNWRMPTIFEIALLFYGTTSALTADYEGSGVAGLVLTSNADSSKKLFFPACGRAGEGVMNNVGLNGYYWSSTLANESSYNAYNFNFINGNVNNRGSSVRLYGHSVRGILANT